jgi:hypothetical protein
LLIRHRIILKYKDRDSSPKSSPGFAAGYRSRAQGIKTIKENQMQLSISGQRKTMLTICACMVGLHAATDFSLFNLKSVQGHGYVLLMEFVLQAAIYMMVPKNSLGQPDPAPTKWMAVVLGVNAMTAVYKLLFIHLLAGAPILGNFQELPFARGGVYEIPQLADGYIDLIANALYQCGLCFRGDSVPLNEPFIAYAFVLISALAGEFNHHILWLTLHTVNLLGAGILLKIAQRVFPSIRFPWVIPVLYVSLFEIHGVTLLLFKDGLIAFLMLSLFYLNTRSIFRRDSNPLTFQILSVILIVLLYNLRTGVLAAILCIGALNCAFDWKNWQRHLRVLLAGILAIVLLGNVDGFSNKLQRTLTRTADKAMLGSSRHLDADNLTYTTTRENSLFHKFKLHEVSPANFLYAPFTKASLYFLLPLPVNKTSSLPDLFHKLSTLIYASLFTTLLLGIWKILNGKNREEWYLLAMFGLLVALFLGAGPMLVPRYRIMTSAFFLLIAAVGASRSSRRLVAMNIGASTIALAASVFWYDDIYNLIQSFT